MAILAIFTSTISKSQYETLRKEVKWEHDTPGGAVLHAASFDAADHLRVADVWESQEAMAAFVEKRLLPAMKMLGITPPDVTVQPLHNLNAYAAIEKHRV